jgi:ribosomal protein S27E
LRVLLELQCNHCGGKQASWSDLTRRVDREGKPIKCMVCGSTDLEELDTLQIG